MRTPRSSTFKISDGPGAYAALTTKKRVRRTTMYSPALFFLSSATSASRPITKFLVTIYSKSCPNHRKASWTYCLCTVPGLLDGWNNLCIPACLKFNYKVFIPTSPGRRLFGPAHKKESGTYYHVQSHSLFSVQCHLRISAYHEISDYNMLQILPQPSKSSLDVLSVYSPGSFLIAGTTYSSRPASNL